ncbi:MAG: HAD family hydrolase, partial [Nanoarchaeota archaeon]|nr:HAD family hydrolase [Nanoarchaeota archaeon]
MHTILFDLDDTLVNTTETIMKRINKIAKKYPISTSDLKYIHDLLPNPERITILSKKYSFSKEIFS